MCREGWEHRQIGTKRVFVKYLGRNTRASFQRAGPYGAGERGMQLTYKLLAILPDRERFPGC